MGPGPPPAGENLHGKTPAGARRSLLPHRRILLELRYFPLESLRHPRGNGTLRPRSHRALQGLGNRHRRPRLRRARLRRMPQDLPRLRRHGTHLPRLALPRQVRLGRRGQVINCNHTQSIPSGQLKMSAFFL